MRRFRIFAAGGEVHVVSRSLHLHDSDPFALFERLRQSGPDRQIPANLDAAHAFYLGYEMCKAAQALTLEKDLADLGLKPVACVDFRIDRGELARRLTARQTCRKCGAAYNTITNPSKKPGVCDLCGGETYVRDDDHPGTVDRRLTEYDMKTAPLIDFYAGRSALLLLDASGTPGAVAARLDAMLGRPERRSQGS